MDISTNNVLRRLRHDAIRHDEWATKKLWRYVLGELVFFSPHWMVSTEQPPVYNSLRRIDIIVEDVNTVSGGAGILLVVEAKKGRASLGDIAEVETQAFTACMEYIIENGRKSVWAMTCFGPEARLWACYRNTTLLDPFFPREVGAGERSAYVDIKGSEESFTHAFGFMMANPVPHPAIIDTATSTYGAGEGSAAAQHYPAPYQAQAPDPSAASNINYSSGQPLVLDPEQCIGVVVKKVKDGQVTYTCPDGTSKITGSQWDAAQIVFAGEYHSCYTYTGQSGTRYWAWTLEPAVGEVAKKSKGKGKGKDKGTKH